MRVTPPRLALAALVALPGAAPGQGFSRPPGVSPTITPAMIRPAWAVPAPFNAGRPFAPRLSGYYPGGPVLAPSYLGGYGYGGSTGYGGYAGYGYGGTGYGGYDPYTQGPTVAAFDRPVPVPLVGAPGFIADGPTADTPAPAELAVDFPADATVTVDGVPDRGAGAARALTTRPLKPGETATLAVRATWTVNGTAYEWTRGVTLARGERSRLTVVGGVKVK